MIENVKKSSSIHSKRVTESDVDKITVTVVITCYGKQHKSNERKKKTYIYSMKTFQNAIKILPCCSCLFKMFSFVVRHQTNTTGL